MRIMTHRFVLATAAVLAACSGAEVDQAELAARAARADSSAAGYPVRDPAPRSSTPVAARPTSPTSPTSPSRATLTTPPLVPSGSPGPARADSARPGTAANAEPGVAVQPVDSTIRVNEFLSYNPARRVMQLRVVAGFNGVNSALNFNGGTNGEHVILVPAGWRVELPFDQRDDQLPHSALVVSETDPLPIDPLPPAFPNAASGRLVDGYPAGISDTLRFMVDRVGRFQIACGVPGHAQGGMWISLLVSSTASRPSYRP